MYNFDKEVKRMGTGSIKYDVGIKKYKANSDFIPLWIADTDFEVMPEIVNAIKQRCEHPVFGYTCTMPDYPEAVTGWYKRNHGLDLASDCVLPTFTVVTAIYFTILTVTKPGDKIMLVTPIYDPFYGAIANTGRCEVDCELVPVGNSYEIDFEQMEAQMKDGVKMLLFCNPHNPTGRVWTRDEMQKIVALCKKYDVFVASDEVHGDLALFGHEYISMLAFPEIRDKTVVYTAPSKTFNLAGMTISNLLIPNQELKTKINNMLRSAFLKTPNVIALTATQAAYENGDAWVAEEKAYLEANSLYVQQYIKEKMPKIKVAKHEGTFLMWLDMRCFGLGECLNRTIVDKCQLALGEGGHYGKAYTEFMRLNIGTRRTLLEQALEKLQVLYDESVK